MAQNDFLIAWLKDAYAMEQAQVEMLERFMKDFNDFTEVKDKLQEHLEATKQQAKNVEHCLDALGSDTSGGKNLLGKMTGAMQGMSIGRHGDKLVKGMIILHASEHFEHACYLAIITAAKAAGADPIATICQTIAEEEEATADWAAEYLPNVVAQTVAQKTE